MNNLPSIEEGEKIVADQLKDELEFHINCCRSCCNVIAMSIEAYPDIDLDNATSSIKVVTSLLAKVLNDLRTASLLSATGYPSQAATIVSSLYESAFMIAYIGDNDDLANKWIEHEDATKLFINVKELTKQGLKNIDTPNYEEFYLQEYNDYRQLCMIKHGNPLVQKNLVYLVEGNSVIADFGPETSQFSIKISWYALERAINYSMIAISGYINFHLIDNTNSEIIELFNSVKESYEEMGRRAVKRWGIENTQP